MIHFVTDNPSHKVLKSSIPIINLSLPCYYSKIRYCPKTETFDKETKIFEKYGSFIKKSVNIDRVVKILKPQFAHHKKHEIQQYIDKINNDQDKIDDYKYLLEFKPAGPEIIQQFLYDVWLFNKDPSGEDEPLVVFMLIICYKIASAIKIKSVYKVHLLKNVKKLIRNHLMT